jgi:LCP family protein required for cell wall assembly
MPKDSDDRWSGEPPEYRVYRSGGSSRPSKPRSSARTSSERQAQDSQRQAQGGSQRQAQGSQRQGAQRQGSPRQDPQRQGSRGSAQGADDSPYRLYRSAPRGLRARLRAESDPELELERSSARRARTPKRKGSWWRTWTLRRAIKYLVLAVVGWVALSFVLFMISAGESPGVPASALSELTPAGNMLTSANTVLILGIDQRPCKGVGSKEPGADCHVAGSNSDTIMLWRVGGGVSRRLSIPRDTIANIPGYGYAKINDGFALGGPALAIKTIKQFTGVQINHVIIVNLAAFPPFINAIGGIDVKTGRVCSNISGGAARGGFSLYLKPGVHHLNGIQALTYARTRVNPCDPADSDLTRVLHQQEILNAIRSQLLSPSTFFRLPWASWAAPRVLQTDMGGLTLMSLFTASELGGSAPPTKLATSSLISPTLGDAQQASPGKVKAAVSQLLNG